MSPHDIEEVMDIEHEAFTAPWSARAYDYELHYNDMAHYFVARPHNGDREVGGEPAAAPSSWWQRWLNHGKRPASGPVTVQAPIVGYGGFWLMVDEAHISTIAAHRAWRRRGIGELLLVSMIDRAAEIGSEIVTLEVRLSNLSAQTLYRKYGFEVTGRRKSYYSDNGEDALIMSTPNIARADFQRQLLALKQKLMMRLSR